MCACIHTRFRINEAKTSRAIKYIFVCLNDNYTYVILFSPVSASSTYVQVNTYEGNNNNTVNTAGEIELINK